ncbi:MAG: tol-pal system protein YbgF [Rhodospirillales bacterium]|nr:tol-pal system protein YbgF [Rhodospirillales bacterium]
MGLRCRRGRGLLCVAVIVVTTAVAALASGAQAQGSRAGTATTPATVPSASSAGSALGRLDERLSALETELRTTTGRVEQLSFRLDQLSNRLETVLSDLEVRLRAADSESPAPGAAAPAGGAASAAAAGAGRTTEPRSQDTSAATTPPASGASPRPADEAPPAPAGALPDAPPEQQYAYAFDLLRQTNYAAAETAFKSFLERHPDDELANNASYWLGETYYVRKDYVKAAETFLDAYQQHKSGPKAPDALLKLAMSLGQLGKKAEACTTLGELNRAFPQASERVKSKAREEGSRLECR